MEEDLRRLADTAEALERQARELREQVAELAEAVRERAEQPLEPAVQAAEPADDSEARVVAYSMVLDERPREEVARHLADELGMTDVDALLDDLYARVAG